MKFPMLGIIENMSYLRAGLWQTGRAIRRKPGDELANSLSVKFLGQVPIEPEIAKANDRGEIEKLKRDYLADVAALTNKYYCFII